MEESIFEQVTSALTVKAICSRLGPDIPSGSTDDDLNMMHCDPDLDPFNNPSRVIGSNGSVLGYASGVGRLDGWALKRKR